MLTDTMIFLLLCFLIPRARERYIVAILGAIKVYRKICSDTFPLTTYGHKDCMDSIHQLCVILFYVALVLLVLLLLVAPPLIVFQECVNLLSRKTVFAG